MNEIATTLLQLTKQEDAAKSAIAEFKNEYANRASGPVAHQNRDSLIARVNELFDGWKAATEQRVAVANEWATANNPTLIDNGMALEIIEDEREQVLWALNRWYQ